MRFDEGPSSGFSQAFGSGRKGRRSCAFPFLAPAFLRLFLGLVPELADDPDVRFEFDVEDAPGCRDCSQVLAVQMQRCNVLEPEDGARPELTWDHPLGPCARRTRPCFVFRAGGRLTRHLRA